MDLSLFQYQFIYREIKKYILFQNSPFNYYSLFSFVSKELKLNFPESKYFENLYQRNFIIKNILFKLQFEFYKDFNFALIFENNLIFFSKIPENFFYFSLIKGEFIELKNKFKFNIDNLPAINSLRDFYFAFENIYKDENEIEKAIDTGLKFANNPAFFEEALKIFNLTYSTLSKKSLEDSFRKLAKKYHPDIIENSELEKKVEFVKIIEAYNMLKQLLL